MKKRTGLWFVFLPLVFPLCLYVIFYERIASKPDSAGFWLILVLGMSLGVIITRLFQWQKTKNPDTE